MSKIIILISLLFVTNVATESIYTLSVTTIEGESKSISPYQGKKLLIITLPVIQNNANDSVLYSIDSLATANGSALVIIAVPSYEDGYTNANKNTLKAWYRGKLQNSIIVTEGMYTRKTSGTQQHALFKWLTDKNKNGHFDDDVDGPKNKFVVWTDGNLIGVLDGGIRIGGLAMKELLAD